MKNIKNSELKLIIQDKGNIRKILDKDQEEFKGFSEAYISEIKYLETKGWKLHKNKTSNMVVVHGYVNFVVWSPDKPSVYDSYKLGINTANSKEFSRITIGPNIWFAFKGLNKPLSRVLNISNKLHIETISETMNLNEVDYKWETL